MTEAKQIYEAAAALIRRGHDILLVRHRGPDDASARWTLPGGIAKSGEVLTETLVREVREETGLEVSSCGGLLYVAQVDDVGNSCPSIVFVFEVSECAGELRPADPDCLVDEARFLPHSKAVSELEKLPRRSMREPILAHIRGEATPGTMWVYRRQPDGTERLTARLPAAGAESGARESRDSMME